MHEQIKGKGYDYPARQHNLPSGSCVKEWVALFAASVPFDYFENIFINGTKTRRKRKQIRFCTARIGRLPTAALTVRNSLIDKLVKHIRLFFAGNRTYNRFAYDIAVFINHICCRIRIQPRSKFSRFAL